MPGPRAAPSRPCCTVVPRRRGLPMLLGRRSRCWVRGAMGCAWGTLDAAGWRPPEGAGPVPSPQLCPLGMSRLRVRGTPLGGSVASSRAVARPPPAFPPDGFWKHAQALKPWWNRKSGGLWHERGSGLAQRLFLWQLLGSGCLQCCCLGGPGPTSPLSLSCPQQATSSSQQQRSWGI